MSFQHSGRPIRAADKKHSNLSQNGLQIISTDAGLLQEQKHKAGKNSRFTESECVLTSRKSFLDKLQRK